MTTLVISFPHLGSSLYLASMLSISPLPENVSTVPSSDHVQWLVVVAGAYSSDFKFEVADAYSSDVAFGVAVAHSSGVASELDFSVDLLQPQRTLRRRKQDKENKNIFFTTILHVEYII